MPEDLPEISPLDLSDDEDSDPILYPPDTRSPEEIAFFEDLKAAYDNPDIYGVPGVPQLFVVRIISYLLPGNPTLISAVVDGDTMPDNLVEVVFLLMSQDPNFPETLKKHGNADFAEFIKEAKAEPNFPEWRNALWKFYLRHFPKFLASASHIAVMSSLTAALLATAREEPDDDLSKMETQVREGLEKEIRSLARTIKQLVGTRSSGRPKKIVSTRGLPKIVNQVIGSAGSMMGDRRGEDAVPGLKEIAVALNFPSSEALGKQLKRANYPWLLSIKPYLAALPPPDKNPS